MIELTAKTIQLVNKIFMEADRLEAIELLKYECADNLPLMHKDMIGIERIRFAAIKFSEGNLEKLYYAVDLSQKDWRDILVFSDFGDDIKAHKVWANSILKESN